MVLQGKLDQLKIVVNSGIPPYSFLFITLLIFFLFVLLLNLFVCFLFLKQILLKTRNKADRKYQNYN